eukprot:2563621-Amphidinium_carterae.2
MITGRRSLHLGMPVPTGSIASLSASASTSCAVQCGYCETASSAHSGLRSVSLRLRHSCDRVCGALRWACSQGTYRCSRRSYLATKVCTGGSSIACGVQRDRFGMDVAELMMMMMMMMMMMKQTVMNRMRATAAFWALCVDHR